MSRVKTKLTYDDYAAIDDGNRYELIDGELCMVPAPNWPHQTIAINLGHLLHGYVQPKRLGWVRVAPLDVIIDEHDVLQPDVFFLSRQRADRKTDAGVRGAPDLVVEILSPTSGRRDRIEKATIYYRAGVHEMWIVDPEAETIEIFLPGAQGFELGGLYHGDQAIRSTVLPDLALRASEAFQD